MDRQGFTIIESLLFMSISAVFIIMAATLLQGRSRDVQFTDATRTLESIVEQVQNRVRNGVSDDTIGCHLQGGGSYQVGVGVTSDGSCILLGELIEFAENNFTTSGEHRQSIEVYPVYGKRLDRNELNGCISSKGSENAVHCVEPYVFTGKTVLDESVPWSVEFYGGTARDDGSGSPILSDTIGFVRNPSSEQIIPFALEYNKNYSGVNIQDAFYDLRVSDPSRTSAVGAEMQGAFYCFQYSDQEYYSALLLGQGERQNSVTMEFEHSPCNTAPFAGYR